MGHVKVGWGQSCITPSGGKVVIAGMVPLRVTEDVHDPLHAVAMVLVSEAGRTIWVSCDFCHPTIRICREVSALLKERLPGFQDEELILNGTHATACFYLTDDEFLHLDGQGKNLRDIMPLAETRRQITAGVVEAVVDASAHLVECEMTSYSAEILTGVCRRVVYKDGSAEMYGDVHRDDFLRMEYPDGGPSQFLYFYSASDHTLLGVFANVPCPSQADESSVHLTADYWGVVRNRVCAELGGNVKVLATCRAAGELSPHRMILSPDKNRNDEWGPQAAARLGNWIADNLIRGAREPMRRYPADAVCHRHITRALDFPVRKVTVENYETALSYMNDPANFDPDGQALEWAKQSNAAHVIKMWETKPAFYRTKVSVMQLGDVLFFTAPVELYAEYAHRISMRYREHPMFDVQLTHDYMGYLPTKEAVLHGGYSTMHFSTVTGPDGGEFYIKEVCRLLDELLETKGDASK